MLIEFKPGEIWQDTEGFSIQAHGGGVMYHEGYYYWYGENKDAPVTIIPFIPVWAGSDGEKKYRHNIDAVGVSCYQSTDLLNWTNCGVVLKTEEKDHTHDLYHKNVVERPKVIYNKATGKFVMWLHVDTSDYQYARAGVAVSDTPIGPFTYIDSYRPNGAMSRDITLFKDDDEKAYIIYSSEGNSTLYITLLSEEYLEPTETTTKNFEKKYREAPAVIKHQKHYYIISSACSGWDPNEAEYAVADHVMGPYEVKSNPCLGKDAEITFGAQSTHILKVEGTDNQYIFMADIWRKENLSDSRYVWLPLIFKDGCMEIRWEDKWKV